MFVLLCVIVIMLPSEANKDILSLAFCCFCCLFSVRYRSTNKSRLEKNFACQDATHGGQKTGRPGKNLTGGKLTTVTPNVAVTDRDKIWTAARATCVSVQSMCSSYGINLVQLSSRDVIQTWRVSEQVNFW